MLDPDPNKNECGLATLILTPKIQGGSSRKKYKEEAPSSS
jgi:hypothetical protein